MKDRRHFIYGGLWGLVILFISCQTQNNEKAKALLREDFSHILEIKQTPMYFNEPTTGLFSDQGSWIGFAHTDSTNSFFGFTGPFSLRTYEWSAKSISEVAAPTGETITPTLKEYLPGVLRLEGSVGETHVRQELFFVDSEVVLLRLSSTSPVDLLLRGRFFDGDQMLSVTQFEEGIEIRRGGEIYRLILPESAGAVSLSEQRYQVPIRVEGETTIAIVYEETKSGEEVKKLLEHTEELYEESSQRWEGYLSTTLRPDMPKGYDRIAVKSIVTLITNWLEAKEGLPHAGVIPSHAKEYFIGFWAWDTWKSAVAMIPFAPNLAKEQIRSMLVFQDSLGMVADCVYADPINNNWRNTKPPLATWAVYEVYKATKEKAFLQEVFPHLLKYHYWWYQFRDVDRNGICEYGSTDGTRIAAAWESGMDNAVRFDKATMLSSVEPHASLNQESVDLNAYLIQERKLLKHIANILNVSFEEKGISEELFRDYFFDAKEHFFFDRQVGTSDFIKILGCEAFAPIWAGIASPKQVELMRPLLTDSTIFNTFVPFPTLSANHPDFKYDGYWRGPIWIDQSYFAISGLRKYGYNLLADQMTEKIFANLSGAMGQAPLFENYDALTGEGLQARHFSWSAAHLLMLYQEYRSE